MIVCAQGEFDTEQYEAWHTKAVDYGELALAAERIMNRLAIDFSGRRRRSPWPGRVLLALAAAVCVDTVMSYRDALELAESLRGAARAGAAARRSRAARSRQEELAAVRDTLERLAMPWDALFGALESAASDQVALLGIEPDAKAGTVVISGDSKDYLAALELRAQPEQDRGARPGAARAPRGEDERPAQAR